MTDSIIEMRQIIVNRNFTNTILTIDNFVLKQAEVAAVVGPNGAGKSTLLQTINLLLDYCGSFRLFGEDVRCTDKTILRRRTSMVYQDVLLLKGSVYDNIAYPLRFRGIRDSEIKKLVRHVMQEFCCDHLAKRPAQLLSGGEVQRVGIARALVSNPELLLLDEPCASLDASIRSEMLEKIRRFALQRGITILLVSHNFEDVLQFAERAIAIFSGKIVQDDRPEQLMRRPATEQVARLTGMDNIISCVMEESLQGQRLRLASNCCLPLSHKVSKQTSLCCLPGDAVYLSDEFAVQQKGPVMLMGMIERVIPDLGGYRVQVKWEEHRIIIRLPRKQLNESLHPGAFINFSFHPEDMHLL